MGAEMGPGPDVEHHHHHHTGHRWLDVTLGVSAIFISLMSLLLALQHGRAMEKMVEVSSWPYVLLAFSNVKADGSPRIYGELVNNGVGPAKISSVEIFYDGIAQTEPKALLRAMLKITDPNRDIRVLQSDSIGTVLPARGSSVVFDVMLGSFTPDEYQVLRQEMSKVDFRVCYCSVFDECSLVDSHKGGNPEHVKVKACPVPKTMFLH